MNAICWHGRNQVRVDQRDAPDNTGRAFHLQVIC